MAPDGSVAEERKPGGKRGATVVVREVADGVKKFWAQARTGTGQERASVSCGKCVRKAGDVPPKHKPLTRAGFRFEARLQRVRRVELRLRVRRILW